MTFSIYPIALWGFPIVIGRADGPHCTYSSSKLRKRYHQQCHCRTQQEKYSTKCNFNASPMMMSFFNYYSRFLSLWCANTHLALYLQYWYLITLHLPPPSLITFYCRIARSVINAQSLFTWAMRKVCIQNQAQLLPLSALRNPST